MGMLDIGKFANPAIENIVDGWAEWNEEGCEFAMYQQNDKAWLWHMRRKVGELVEKACRESFAAGYHSALKDQEIMGRKVHGT